MSHHYATSAMSEAINRTILLLWPPKSGIWIRVAIIALFLGGGMVNPIRNNSFPGSGASCFGIPGSMVLSDFSNLVYALALGLLIAGFVYVVISAIFQFIFVDCLSTNTILLTRTFHVRWKQGLRLVGFYLFLLALILFSAVILVLLFIAPAIQSGALDFYGLMLLIIESLLLLLVILIPVWVLAILTADFVVPVMIVDECGIVSGWRRMITIFSGRWIEAVIYTAGKIILIFVSGAVLGIILFLLSIPLGIPAMIISAGTGVSQVMEPTGIVFLGLGTAVLFLLSLVLLVPVITFFRYYSLAFLRDLEPVYNLLPCPIP